MEQASERRLTDPWRVALVTAWVVAVTWGLQSYVANRSAADMALQAHRTAREVTLERALPNPGVGTVTVDCQERLSMDELEALRSKGKQIAFHPDAATTKLADAIDYAVRRIGMGFVTTANLPPEQFYLVSVALLERGYSEEEVEGLAKCGNESSAQYTRVR